MEISVRGQTFQLLWQKAIWWKEQNWLIISDLHIGKVEHFRNSGIGIPATAGHLTLSRLSMLISDIKPDTVFFLGDLFHSKANSSVVYFRKVITEIFDCTFLLVQGNHDILMPQIYKEIGIEVLPEFSSGDITLIHEISGTGTDIAFYIGGHIHPAVRVRGKGKQSDVVPCFYKTETSLILPAFGYFTGVKVITPQADAGIYGIAGTEIFEIPVHALGL